MRSLSSRQVALFLVLALSGSAASAQSPSSRWAAWLGCWSPVTDAGVGRSMTCVIPGETAEAAEFIIVAGDSIEQRSVVTADGTTRRIDAEGCVGTEVSRFSDDGTRVFLSGEVRCGGGATQVTSGVISISETGEWVDVHGVRVGDQRSLRVRRSRAAITGASLPAEIRSALANTGRSSGVARLAAAVPLSLPRVHETAAQVDERVAEAWLLETNRDGTALAPVDAKALAQLEDAGIPDRVIDVVVAISYPKRFQVFVTEGGEGEIAKVASTSTAATSAREYDRRASRGIYGDPFFSSLYGRQRCYNYACYMYYSDSPYYYGLGGWNAYGGYGMYPGWGYGGPITIVVRPSEPGGGGGGGGGGASGGRVVKGRGYTSGGTGSEPAQPRSTESTSMNGSSARGSSTSSSSSGSTSAGRSSTTTTSTPSEPARTAKPRNP